MQPRRMSGPIIKIVIAGHVLGRVRRIMDDELLWDRSRTFAVWLHIQANGRRREI